LSRPTEIIKRLAQRKAATAELTETKRLQLEWWSFYADALASSKGVPSVQTPRAQHWLDVALGRSGFHLSNTVNTFDNTIGVRLYMRHRSGAEAALEQLLQSRDAIEKEIGEKLAWDPNPDARDKTVTVSREADITRRDRWEEYCRWMVDMTVRFRRVFSPRVRELDLENSDVEEELVVD